LSDNEKLEKENEQFSSAILYVATAVYVGVCAMVFGALYAKMPSFGEAFLTLMKDYGTILAGIPVLVAVVVAKQQLDANRRQHVATIKRSFKDQIEALEALKRLTSFVSNTSYLDGVVPGKYEGTYRFNYWDVSAKTKESIASYFDEDLNKLLSKFEADLSALTRAEWYQISSPEHVDFCFECAQSSAEKLGTSLDHELSKLSQYWS